MSGEDFQIDPASLREAAAKLHGHAGEVEGHGHTLSARTEGRVGHGPIGELAETLVKRGLNAISEGITKAVSDFHRATAEGLELAARRTEEADAGLAATFDANVHSAHHGVADRLNTRLSPGGRPLIEGPAPGGRSDFMAPGEAFSRNAAQAPEMPGFYDVIVHGSPTDFGGTIDAWQRGDNFNHRTLATMIRNDPAYDGGPIRLMSCSTGAPGATAAQNLANKLGVNVMAPTDILWAWPSGRLGVGPKSTSLSGGWQLFRPGRVP